MSSQLVKIKKQKKKNRKNRKNQEKSKSINKNYLEQKQNQEED